MSGNKLKTKTKIAFACGDIFGGGAFNIINFLYPAYAALTLGLGASLAGIIVMISKIWDAVTDPIMGQISDRTSSKMGKRRIYILVASPFVVLSLFLLFFGRVSSNHSYAVFAVFSLDFRVDRSKICRGTAVLYIFFYRSNGCYDSLFFAFERNFRRLYRTGKGKHFKTCVFRSVVNHMRIIA